jgi:bifunctional oligoribonuclease and PAP phosphatase NrnA
MEQNTQTKLSANWQTLISPKEPGSRLLAKYSQEVRDIHMSLKMARSVLIGTHEHPDGDALGSSMALMQALRLQGKKVTVFAPNSAPDMFHFLPGIEYLTTTTPDPAQFDVVVLLDSTTIARVNLNGLIESHPNTICIDHHYHNVSDCTLNLVVPEAAATAHILTVFFEETKTPVTKDMATCLLTGIFTDTGSFMHDSTTPDIMKLAAFLMGKGARLSHIAHETYQKKDLPGLKIWGRALSRTMTNKKTGATVSIITATDLKECNAALDDLSGVVNILNTLSDTKFAMLLTEYEPGKIKGSLRSEPHKGVDVSQIAKNLGGGGHKLAAGFEVEGHLVEKNGHWRIEAIKK